MPAMALRFASPNGLQKRDSLRRQSIAGEFDLSGATKESRFKSLDGVTGKDKDGLRRVCSRIEFAKKVKLGGVAHPVCFIDEHEVEPRSRNVPALTDDILDDGHVALL